MKRIEVRHATGRYEIVIGPGASRNPDVIARLGSRPALIVTDENVAANWLDAFRASLPSAHVLVLPAGEAFKTLATASAIWSKLADIGAGRDAVLVALGGGVIGDITGFAAACWMRGIDFVQVPTTLLAQVDASVGGKTAVDLPAGKNLVGAFHQPLAVLADTDMLATLPTREFSAGFAEIVKAALLADAGFLAWLESNREALNERTPEAIIEAVFRSCVIKADIVSADERESGIRALLNLGHTFAHALEQVTGYERFLHGEAVAIGLVLAAALSEAHFSLDPDTRLRVARLLEGFGLPTTLPADVKPDEIIDAMQLDKKHVKAHWRLVLLERIGTAVVVEFPDTGPVRRVLADD
ncbi:MAG: 3-dehydroquinate synthase [Proteobacteria bacterium]|nr:3-dehydroquinate synthase [Pseudomonadota bacterium]